MCLGFSYFYILRGKKIHEIREKHSYVSGEVDGSFFCLLEHCPGFGWDRVNSLLSSWYSAGFWIYCENDVDNTLMF